MQVENKYRINILSNAHGILRKDGKIPNDVEFKDKSANFQPNPEQPSSQSLKNIALPSPHFISIHAAIAGILHVSGTGNFLDELFHKFKPTGPALHSWDKFDKTVQHYLLREKLSTLLVP